MKKIRNIRKVKKIIAIALAALILLTACSESEIPPVDEIYRHIEESFKLPIMSDINGSRFGEYNINPDDTVDFIAKEAAISAIFVQVIIIKAADGRVDEVRRAMLKQQASLSDAAFYPNAQEAAASSIVGTKGNLVYLICHADAVEIENILLKFIS